MKDCHVGPWPPRNDRERVKVDYPVTRLAEDGESGGSRIMTTTPCFSEFRLRIGRWFRLQLFAEEVLFLRFAGYVLYCDK